MTGDYDYAGFDDTTLAGICCLGTAPAGAPHCAPDGAPRTEYGAPYISEGFALLSLLKTAPFDVASALFNADVGNAALVIILCVPNRSACKNDPLCLGDNTPAHTGRTAPSTD